MKPTYDKDCKICANAKRVTALCHEGHTYEKPVVETCKKCGSEKHTKCFKCPNCRKFCNEETVHAPDTRRVITFSFVDRDGFTITKTVPVVNSSCPNVRTCHKCEVRHEPWRCPQARCSFCEEVGHISGSKCPMNRYNSNRR